MGIWGERRRRGTKKNVLGASQRPLSTGGRGQPLRTAGGRGAYLFPDPQLLPLLCLDVAAIWSWKHNSPGGDTVKPRITAVTQLIRTGRLVITGPIAPLQGRFITENRVPSNLPFIKKTGHMTRNPRARLRHRPKQKIAASLPNRAPNGQTSPPSSVTGGGPFGGARSSRRLADGGLTVSGRRAALLQPDHSRVDSLWCRRCRHPFRKHAGALGGVTGTRVFPWNVHHSAGSRVTVALSA